MAEPDTRNITNIIILDTHPVLRKGLAVLLQEGFSELRLIEARDVVELRQAEPELGPSLFIVVINSDFEEDGTSPVFELKTVYPDAPIILYGEETKPELVISYFKSGINGYLSKHKDLSELTTCINMVRAGKRYVNADHMDFLFGYLIENYKTSKKRDLLTPRQNEIARYLIQGLSTSSIAEKTGLHISTISTFKTAIFSKLGIDNVLKLKQILEAEEN
ncbi:response regulator transcription factor [Dyadobacter fanqingshengii]|uniref:Response regulator transcription factor n=1 Tax=Dyadobacter fanqingshengii TaxID=2906443 RepID=A0A9X1PB24_9BACT|nr:response regulator transcription factor [Dyadobacter fanqingshengii]MCF0041971.1 response regulator transcription factor [Dyadobacter fanqingshengii]USJ36324.1 response regulator transcription factor [Dyadobacter fanqingshengii]